MPSDDQPKSPAAPIQKRGLSFHLVGLADPPFFAVGLTPGSEPQESHAGARSKAVQRAASPVRIDAGLLPSRIPPSRPAVPRDKITGPLSPVPEPTDETLFEDAAKPEVKFYLPRYRVAEQTVSGKAQFRIKLDQQAQGGTLTVFLERFPAPKLEPAARQATEIPHSIAVKLVARIPMGSSQIQQELVFQEIIKEGELLKAVLRLEQLAQLTQAYQILTEASLAASLIVQRSASMAVPVPANSGAEIQQLAAQIQKLQQEINDLNKQVTALEARKRQLEKLGAANPAARRMLQALQIQLNKLNAQRSAKATELRQKRLQLAALRRQKLFRVAPRLMDWAVAPSPFVFAKDLHRYIFGNVAPPDGQDRLRAPPGCMEGAEPHLLSGEP